MAAGSGKADFDDIYDQPDPRAYFHGLSGLDYEIPQQAQPVFGALLGALRERAPGGEPARVLDICCSYGINAALLRHDVSLDDLFDRYTSADCESVSAAELAAADADFFARRRRPDPVSVSGLDAAANAVTYACQVGLLEHGWAENLEEAAPSAAMADDLAGIDLVTITGGGSYITERTIGRVVEAGPAGSRPWVAAFVLRMIDYERVAERLERLGMVTERLSRTFPQRRFASASERDAALLDVSARGLDVGGLEETGRYYADLYVSRPAADAAGQPLEELLDASLWSGRR